MGRKQVLLVGDGKESYLDQNEKQDEIEIVLNRNQSEISELRYDSSQNDDSFYLDASKQAQHKLPSTSPIQTFEDYNRLT